MRIVLMGKMVIRMMRRRMVIRRDMMSNILHDSCQMMMMSMIMIIIVARYHGAGPSLMALSATLIVVLAGKVCYCSF